MNRFREIVDSYLYYAIFIDCIIIITIYLLNNSFSIIPVEIHKKENNINIISNIIGTSVSLAGFILASLTVIVAIRSNILRKKPEESNTPLELFFSIGTYKTIVKVFKIAIFELIVCFIGSYLIWVLSPNISNSFIYDTVIILIYLMAVSTIRSLFVLFILIKVDS